jgi:FAD/FMN-containing dehydrogenase
VGAYGLVTGFGDTGSVGIGGITLGGGMGLLVRKYGLTIDNLLAAEIVTADGELLRVSTEKYPDLFWAIRGGGGNFGVAIRFNFRLHKLDMVVGGMLMLPATPEVIASLIAEAEVAPEELSIIANVLQAQSTQLVPAEHQGQPVIMALLVYAGDVDEGERVIAPFRKLATPIADMVQPMHYSEIYRFTEGGPSPIEEAAHSMFIDAIDLHTAEIIVDHLKASTAQLAVAQLWVLGGAMARIPSGATAFAHREQRILVGVGAVYEHKEEAAIHEAWVSSFAKALNKGKSGVYVNFLGDEGEARVREAYPESTWDRLRLIKRRYDQTNLFRLNQNIPPATSLPGKS